MEGDMGKEFSGRTRKEAGEQRRRRDGFNQRQGPGTRSIDGRYATRWTDTEKDDSVCIGPGWKGMDGWGAMGKACRSGAGYLTSVLGRSAAQAGKSRQARFGWKTGWGRGPGEGTERAIR